MTPGNFPLFLHYTSQRGFRIGPSTSWPSNQAKMRFFTHTFPMKSLFSTHFWEETSNIENKKYSPVVPGGNPLVPKITSPLIVLGHSWSPIRSLVNPKHHTDPSFWLNRFEQDMLVITNCLKPPPTHGSWFRILKKQHGLIAIKLLSLPVVLNLPPKWWNQTLGTDPP